MRNSRCKTLIVIPCYNEEHTIANIIQKTKKHAKNILVIDDGSADNTAQVAKNEGVIVIIHEKNQGKGAAIKTGFNYALKHGYEYVVTIDGDGQHNPDEIPQILKPIMKEDYDISLGFRVGNNTEMPNWRRIGKRLLDYFTSIGNGGFVTDSQCGFRAFNRNALEKLTPRLKGKSFSTESEQLIHANQCHLKLINTKVTCKYKNLYNTSKKNPAFHGVTVLILIFKSIAELHPIFFFGVPCFIMFIGGLILGSKVYFDYQVNGVLATGNALITLLLILVGISLPSITGLIITPRPNTNKRKG